MNPDSISKLRSTTRDEPKPGARLGVLRVLGRDARKLLNGLVTSDLVRLTPSQAILTGLTSPRGRILAIVTLIERDDALYAILPDPLIEQTMAHIRRYRLREEIELSHDTGWCVTPLYPTRDAAPARPGDCAHESERTTMRWWSKDDRRLILHRSATHPSADGAALSEREWHAGDIASGLPTIVSETANSFIPQDLNLDLIGGVDYDKGCYVGQEVVARARRAKRPRRLLRFSGEGDSPSFGALIRCGINEVGRVVDLHWSREHGELLACVDLEECTGPLTLGESALVPQSLPYELGTPRPSR